MNFDCTSRNSILFIASNNIGKGGLSTMAYRWILDLNRMGIGIDLFTVNPFTTPSPFVDKLEDIGCVLTSANTKEKKSVINIVTSLKTVVKNGRYSIVHIHTDTSYKALIHAFASKLGGCKHVVVHSHSCGVENPKTVILAVNAICRQILPIVTDVYISCSDLASKWLFPKSVQRKVIIIENDSELSKFSFNQIARNEVREELRVGDKVVIGHIGRFSYQKNQPTVLKIFSAFHVEHPNSVLILVGTGEEDWEKSVNDKINELGIHDSVIRIPYSNQIHRLIQAIDVLILPSRFEGNPVVVAECLASGMPCIISDNVTRMCDPLGQAVFLDNEETTQWQLNIESSCVSDDERKSRSSDFISYHDSLESSSDQLYNLYEDMLQEA